MGGLVSGLFNLFSGDPAKKERAALGDLYGYETNKGQGALNQGLDFYSDIMSGDPARIAQALSPEIKAGQDMITQQGLQGSFFGNRAGGTNAASQAAQAGERGNIIDLIGKLQSGSAGALTGAGENLLNMGSGNIVNSADLAYKNRQRQAQAVGDVAGGAASIAMPFLGAGEAAPGLEPHEFTNLMNTGTVQPGSLDTSSILAHPIQF